MSRAQRRPDKNLLTFRLLWTSSSNKLFFFLLLGNKKTRRITFARLILSYVICHHFIFLHEDFLRAQFFRGAMPGCFAKQRGPKGKDNKCSFECGFSFSTFQVHLCSMINDLIISHCSSCFSFIYFARLHHSLSSHKYTIHLHTFCF